VVRLLEQAELDLDESLKLWERASSWLNGAKKHLAGARQRVADALAAGQAEGILTAAR